MIRCTHCGHPGTGDGSPCPHCGSLDQTVELTSVASRVEVPGVTTVADFTDPATAVRFQNAAGGSSESLLSADRFRAEVIKPVQIGRAGEPRALEALRAALVAAGRQALPVAGADDGRGEDGRLQVDGHVYDVQIVTVPAVPAFWQDVQTLTSATTDVPLPHAVGWVREAIEQKARAIATPGQRATTILGLDVTHLGALSAPAIVEAYGKTYPDPSAEEWGSVWLLGPTPSLCTQLGQRGT